MQSDGFCMMDVMGGVNSRVWTATDMPSLKHPSSDSVVPSQRQFLQEVVVTDNGSLDAVRAAQGGHLLLWKAARGCCGGWRCTQTVASWSSHLMLLML